MEAKQRGIGARIDNKPIVSVLDEMAGKVDDYYFLPYWFRINGDTIISYHLDDLPQNLKNLIEDRRNPQATPQTESTGIPLYDTDGKISKEYMVYTEKEMQLIKDRSQSLDKSIEELWREGVKRKVVHQFEQNGCQMGMAVNYFDETDLMKVIEAGIKSLKMEARVFLTGYIKEKPPEVNPEAS